MPGEPQTLPVGNLRKVVERFGFVELAYLFGSFVRGEVYHDLDLGLVLNESLSLKERWPYALKVAGEAEKAIKYAVPVDVRLLNEAPPKFSYQVLKTGRLLFARSEAVRIRYEKEIMLAYLDFQETDRWFDAKLLEAVSRL
ncbi:MAG: nucleotidyltransferase domain-containing protein [Bacillota bacterium]